jgi:hypothetical protein
MVNCPKDLDLAIKGLEIVGRLFPFVDNFDSNHATREFPACFVDSAKGTLTDLLDEVVIVHL